MVQTVARLAERFKVDPIELLRSTDPFELDVRVACAQIIADDEKKQQQSQRSGSRPSRGRRR
jgi:hypothetical protein